METVLITCAAEGIPVRFAAGEFIASDRVYETPFGLEDIERRQTSRLPYEPGRLPAEVLAGARRHLGPGERLHELAAREVLPLFIAADRHMYESDATIGELRRWLRLSKRHPDCHRDGLTYECLDLSTVEARALALLLRPKLYRLVKATRLHRTFTAASKSLLDVDGSVLVLEHDATGEILDSGRTLMRVWLELSAAGFYTHPLSQIIDYEITERELASHLRRSEDQRVLSVFRVGRSDEPARSHRLV